MNHHWSTQGLIYQFYPLGTCGAPHHNDFVSAPVDRLSRLEGWIDHLAWLGVNTVLLGPVFESGSHGYDTADYFWVDRRLGTNDTLRRYSAALHQRGMHLILDGVFNHVGRNFWAFRDVQLNGQNSAYTGWFEGIDFSKRSPNQDAFAYQGWNGHYSLVKLNLSNPDVRNHLFKAVASWVNEFDIDGLRLDAVESISPDFIAALAAYCRPLKPDFWMVGEVVHGDYRKWAAPGMLDSVTNYEVYKGLYSSLNDANFFEIAYALNRQFAANGMYANLGLYNFVDNHDVSRVASLLKKSEFCFPLYLMLLTIPGIPGIYYGSEWGLEGRKDPKSDWPLRPELDLGIMHQPPVPGLAEFIQRLAGVRARSLALRLGSYRQLFVQSQQLGFVRQYEGETVVVLVNSADATVRVEWDAPVQCRTWRDMLAEDVHEIAYSHRMAVEVPAYGGLVLRAEG